MKKKRTKPQPREVRVASSTHQPSKAELEETFDMPGWTTEQMRENLLGPIKLVEDEEVLR